MKIPILFNFENELKNIHSILDIGCGYRSILKDILYSKNSIFSVGTDICLDDLIFSKTEKKHDQYVCADVKKLCFKENSFDAVICMHVIEHLDKNVGRNVIKMFEKIAQKKVIIGIPNGAKLQGYMDRDNLRVGHISYWSRKDLGYLGYKVIPTDGIKYFEKINIKREFREKFFFKRIIQLQEVITKIIPELSLNYIAIKELNKV